MFSGTYTALVTPFRNDEIDVPALERLIETQIAGGITGIVPVGTTGESPTLSCGERHQVIELAVKVARNRCLVIAGTGSNSTRDAILHTKEAEEIGVDGALLVAPYYNKPSQEGLFRHFAAIAEATSLGLVLYNIPGRCGVDIAADTVVRLAQHCPNIVAIKEASGSVDRVSELVRRLPEGFTVLSGDDSLTLPFLSVGAAGVVSVASNLFPAEISRLVRLFLDGKVSGGLPAAPEILRSLQGSFHRTESSTGKDRARLARRDGGRLPVATHQHEQGERRTPAQNVQGARTETEMSATTRVLLVGALGRMGQALAAAVAKDSGLTVAAALDRGDSMMPAIDVCDVVIDFSAADATAAVCATCAQHRKPLVLGTTGQNDAQKESVAATARVVPIVFAANFSVGVNTLFALTRHAAQLLGSDFDLDVIEMHHRTKKDAPSGTAKRLVEILQEVSGTECARLRRSRSAPATSWATTRSF